MKKIAKRHWNSDNLIILLALMLCDVFSLSITF